MDAWILGCVYYAVRSSSRRATALAPVARSSRRVLSDCVGRRRSLPAELPLGASVRGRSFVNQFDGLIFLLGALMLLITAVPMVQIPSVNIVSVALSVVIGAISTSKKERSVA
jgi:hypothetical protein